VDGVECVRCAGCLLLVGKGGILGTCPPIIILRNRYPVVQYKGGNLGIYISFYFLYSLYILYIYIYNIYIQHIYINMTICWMMSPKEGEHLFKVALTF
jgi:hypothetical protein